MAKKETEVSREEIARRAHEISLSDERGTDEENWHRAEEELREALNSKRAPRKKSTGTTIS